MSKVCSVEGCNGKHLAKGYCNRHYKQFKKHGHTLERTYRDLNEIIEYDDYAEIVLYDKQGKEIARAIIDLEYVDSVKKYKWSYRKNDGYASNKTTGLLHRFIMNPSDDMVVDHINGNKLDNRRCNLRICTNQQNSFNHKVLINNESGHSGIYFRKDTNKWRARIKVGNKDIHLGYFKTLEEAIEARRQAEIEYFGEFAPTRD